MHIDHAYLKKYIFLSLVLLSIFGVAKYIQNSKNQAAKSHLKCPEDYSSEEEYKNDFMAFLKDFTANNPEATIGDLGKVRTKFLVDNHCQKTLDSIQRGETDKLD